MSQIDNPHFLRRHNSYDEIQKSNGKNWIWTCHSHEINFSDKNVTISFHHFYEAHNSRHIHTQYWMPCADPDSLWVKNIIYIGYKLAPCSCRIYYTIYSPIFLSNIRMMLSLHPLGYLWNNNDGHDMSLSW